MIAETDWRDVGISALKRVTAPIVPSPTHRVTKHSNGSSGRSVAMLEPRVPKTQDAQARAMERPITGAGCIGGATFLAQWFSGPLDRPSNRPTRAKPGKAIRTGSCRNPS